MRAARRRSVAAAAAARARAEAQQAAQQPAVVVKERTEIPIEVVDSTAQPPLAPAGSSASGDAPVSSSGDDSRGSSRSTASRQAGYASESESTEIAEGDEAGPAARADTPALATGEPTAAAEQQAVPQPATAKAAAAPVSREQAATQPPGQEAQAAAPPQQVQALLSEEELDIMKEEADRLQLEGQADAAEALYARYSLGTSVHEGRANTRKFYLKEVSMARHALWCCQPRTCGILQLYPALGLGFSTNSCRQRLGQAIMGLQGGVACCRRLAALPPAGTCATGPPTSARGATAQRTTSKWVGTWLAALGCCIAC